jgi:hypothetical protein
MTVERGKGATSRRVSSEWECACRAERIVSASSNKSARANASLNLSSVRSRIRVQGPVESLGVKRFLALLVAQIVGRVAQGK